MSAAKTNNPLHPVEQKLAQACTETIELNLASWHRFAGMPTWIELQALEVGDEWKHHQFAHANGVEAAAALASHADWWRALGVYVIANPLVDGVTTRAVSGKWHKIPKNGGTTDAEIACRTVLPIDVDAVRPKGTSATETEMAYAVATALAIYDEIAGIIEGDDAMGYGHTGNGRMLFLALDSLDRDEAGRRHKAILIALGARYSTEHAEVDQGVFDAKRLVPAWGTTKKKGAPGNADRPHRKTAFVCGEAAQRLRMDDLDRLVATLRDGLPDEWQKKIDQALGIKPASKVSRDARSGEDAFARANAVPVTDVLEWLELLDGGHPRCPGCGTSGDSSVAIVANGVKCMHARCAGKGRDGFRTVIDLVTEVHGFDKPIDAVRALGERFGFDMPRSKRTTPGNLPIVRLGLDLDRVVREAAQHLGGSEGTFARGGVLVRVIADATLPPSLEEDDRELKAGAVNRFAGAVTIRPHVEASLKVELSTVMRFSFVDEEGKDVLCRAPRDIILGLLAAGTWHGIRPLEGVASAPILRANGTIAQAPGYDDASRRFLVFDPACIVPIAEEPNFADAVRARDSLLCVVGDFPFQNNADRSAWLALVLTLLARSAIDGPCPMWSITANVRGAGKSRLVDVATIIATGRAAPRATQPEDDAAAGKLITSIVLEADELLLLDNIARPLGGSKLDALLTGERWKDRLLGVNATIDLPIRTVLTATGNNIEYVGDTIRRVLPVRLDSAHERPEEREDFAIKRLLAYVREHRARLVADALTILRVWYVSGCPRSKAKIWGSFEGWSDVIPHVLMFVGLPDPQETRANLEDDDPKLHAQKVLIAEWPKLEAAVETAVVAAGETPVQMARRFARLDSPLAERAPSMGLTVNGAITWLFSGFDYFELAQQLRVDLDAFKREVVGLGTPIDGTPIPAFLRDLRVAIDALRDLREALEVLAPARGRPPVSGKGLGNVLRGMKNRVFGGKRMKKVGVDGHDEIVRWGVR